MKGVECAVITSVEEPIDIMALIAMNTGSQSTVSDTDTGIQELWYSLLIPHPIRNRSVLCHRHYRNHLLSLSLFLGPKQRILVCFAKLCNSWVPDTAQSNNLHKRINRAADDEARYLTMVAFMVATCLQSS